MGDVAPRPQVEGGGRADTDLGRALVERPLVRHLEQGPANALSPRVGGNREQLDVADSAAAVVLQGGTHRALSPGRAEHDSRIVPATTEQLVEGQLLVGERRLGERREFVSPFASPLVHYGRLVVRRLGLAVVVVLLATGCHQGASTPGRGDGASLDFDIKATIVVDDSGIHPDVTQGRVGEAITVTNRGTKDRGLTSDTIETGTLRPGESTTLFLTETGTIEVRDRTDPSHEARIEVSPEASS